MISLGWFLGVFLDDTHLETPEYSTASVALINSLMYRFDTTVNPAIPPCTAKSLTLTYDSIDDLTSVHSYKGRIGVDDLELT
ncbi:hypothetical protein F5Y08DRAFT_318169 [Xylaria arbuscula]|nr:hypothetical protein F5Y08DRAFT_318169 [Xylaria arbuscula]